MLERRSFWGLIVLLNVFVVIWHMQEPAILSVEFVGGDGENEKAPAGLIQTKVEDQQHYTKDQDWRTQLQKHRPNPQQKPSSEWLSLVEQPAAQDFRAQHQQKLYAGKHLLAESAEANDSVAKVRRKTGDKYSSGSGTSSTTTSTSRIRHYKNKKNLKPLAVPNLNPNIAKATSPLSVVTATLKNSAITTTKMTTTATNITAKHLTESYSFPPNDYQQLIDLHDFTFLINQARCSRDIQALILVHSAPTNEAKRRLIRETWGNTDAMRLVSGAMPLRVIFLVGTVATEAEALDIERENFENGDIIQGSFVDSYRNMTYKHVMAFKWFLYNCAHAQILVKVDDDVYMNTPQLLIYLQRSMRSEELENGIQRADTFARNTAGNSYRRHTLENGDSMINNGSDIYDHNVINDATDPEGMQFIAGPMLFRHPHNLLFCKTNTNAQVKRSFRSKWRVAMREHSAKYYPPYCPGFSIIYSPDVVWRLYIAVQRSKYFWIDDVHITGILAQEQSINITNAQPNILYEEDCDNLLNGMLKSDEKEFLYSWHLIQPEQMQKLWQLYLDKAKRELVLSSMHSTKKTLLNEPTDEFNRPTNYR